MSAAAWLGPDELRVGLGCMRLSTDPERDEAKAQATIVAAVEAGITVFDTAHAYGRDDHDLGHNERLLAKALRASGAGSRARVVTKGGMRRPEGRWVPDGRAATLRADAEASLAALDGLPIDLFLLHAPDSRTPWATSVRALAALVDSGLVRRIGLSNVNRLQLDEALQLAPIAAVETSLSCFDDEALRSGVISRCAELSLPVLAHAPLGGVKRASTMAKHELLSAIALKHDATAQEVALALLLDLDPCIVAIPGARRAQTARSSAAATRFKLDDSDRSSLRERFGLSDWLAPSPRPQAPAEGEVVMIMGIQGAGKTVAVAHWVSRGYERLNRDDRGGTLRGLRLPLEQQLAANVRRLVLDNTYATRASRADVIRIASRFGIPVRCIWMDTPMAEAQVNVVRRMLTHHGRLLDDQELRRGSDQFSLPPNALFRTARELEPPNGDEGFAAIEVVPFQRRAYPDHSVAGRFISFDALPTNGPIRNVGPDTPTLVFGWRPGATPEEELALQERLAAAGPHDLTVAFCPHPAGPPRCWCRPPLPGLLLTFVQARNIDPTRSVVVGTSPAHRTMATAVGAVYEDAS